MRGKRGAKRLCPRNPSWGRSTVDLPTQADWAASRTAAAELATPTLGRGTIESKVSV